MSWMNQLEPPEPEYDDDEWSTAHTQLVEERLEDGWSEREAEAMVDDWLIAEQCERNREGRAWTWADDERARRKEGM